MGCFLAVFVCQHCGIVSLVLSRLSRKREPLMNLAQQEESNRGCWAEKGEREMRICESRAAVPNPWISTGPYGITYITSFYLSETKRCFI